MIEVTIDKHSGFCFGVVYAIQMAEEYLMQNGTLYCLGDIVHNDLEVSRLKAKGLQIIGHEDLEHLRDTAVLIRAHGEPPSTYQLALQNNIQLIDASCPVVLKLQNRVRTSFSEQTQIIIYGKPGHAEVNGLIGQTHNQAIVITCIEDLDNAPIDYSKPIQLFSQTTKSTAKFYEIKAEIEKRAQQAFKANDTICRQVSNREPQLSAFAKQYQVIIFVAGKKSSNGKVLYEVCKQNNPLTFFISEISELQTEWFLNVQTVGICGATSTPLWQMEQAKQWIENLSLS